MSWASRSLSIANKAGKMIIPLGIPGAQRDEKPLEVLRDSKS